MKVTIFRHIAIASFVVSAVILIGCTSTPEGLGIPKLVSPPDKTTATNPPAFVWQSVEGAGAYWLQVATTTGFVNPSFWPCEEETTFTTTTVLNPGTYYWRVCGLEGG